VGVAQNLGVVGTEQNVQYLYCFTASGEGDHSVLISRCTDTVGIWIFFRYTGTSYGSAAVRYACHCAQSLEC
jgi:hypothetical protein